MRRFSFSSLRVRLLLLVLLAVVPALGLIIYTGAETRRTASMEAQANALRLAQSVSSTQDDLFEGARQLLIALAQLPEVRKRDSKACNTLFANLLKQYPLYSTLGAADAKGDPFCSAIPIRKPFNVADRAWFQRAIQYRGFGVGDYTMGRVTGKASLHFGYPVLDDGGAVQAVVLVGLDLDWLNAHIAKSELPAGTTLTVIDRKGTILVRFPESEKWVGKSMPETPLAQTILSRGEGMAEVTGMDGISRLYGFSPLGKTGDAYVSIGVPKSVAFATANRILIRNLMGGGIVSALAFLAAWFGANLFVLRQVHALTGIAKRLSGGELGARTGLSYGQGELGELARVFDQMAEGLQARQAEAERAEEQIQRQLQRITALREINLATTSTLDLHTVLNVLMEKIDRFLPYTAVLVWLQNKESGQLDRAACWNLDEEDWKGRPLNRTPLLVQAAIESKAPVVASNVQTDPRTLDPEFYRRHGLVSYLGVPLVAKGEALGVLVFLTREEHEFAKEEVEFLSTLAGQAAIAIENARLYDEASRRAKKLQALNKLSRLITSSLSTQDAFSFIVESLVTLLDTEVARLWVFDSGQGVLRLKGAAGEPELISYPQDVFRPGEGLVGSVFQSKEVVVITDPATDPRYSRRDWAQKMGITQLIAVPILKGEQALGAISAAFRYPRPLSQEDISLVIAFADQAAIAIHNSQLHERTVKQAGELEKADKVKDEFLGFVSHELRTPLNAMIAYTIMMQDKLLGEVNAEQEKTLEKILGHSKDLLAMINSLLEVTRIQAGRVEVESHTVNLDRFLEDLKSTYDVPTGKELMVTWDYPSDLPTVKTDSGKLRHILQNLINNAIKFTEKGMVKVSARSCSEAGRVEFKVEDTGVGIPQESLPVIFEMFRQVSGSAGKSGGVGLGLHIVKKFTEMLGGEIAVESEVGKGSTFTVTIPYES